MNEPTNPHQAAVPTAALRVLQIIWAALLLGVVALFIVDVNVGIPNHKKTQPPQPTLTMVSFIMGAVVLPVVFAIRLRIFNRSRLERGTLTLTAYQTGNIIFWSGCEGVSYFALVVALVNGTLWPTIVAAAIASGLQFLTFPTGTNVNQPVFPGRM